MAVIINDLEVIVDAPGSGGQSQPGGESSQPAAQSPISPQDITAVMSFQASRRARVRAH